MPAQPKKDPELAALEHRIKAEIKEARQQADQYLPSQALGLADVRKLKNRIAAMLAQEVIHSYAALLGHNAYIRQITRHSGSDSYTAWQVGLFHEIGKYTVLADERQPHVALAKALHQSGTILPEK